MADAKEATGEDSMRSSANALTKKLHATLMDVFGNYVTNDEDDYKSMVETLRNKQVRKQTRWTPAKPDDPRNCSRATLYMVARVTNV